MQSNGHNGAVESFKLSQRNISVNTSPNGDSPVTNGHHNGYQQDHIKIPLRSYKKWNVLEQGATLVWRDVSVYVKESGGLKRIINNSSGAIGPGTLMALMGSSGSGKSTLMSALSYRNSAGTIVHGDILVNGRRIGPFMHRISGFVHQDDLFHGTLTVLEHLTFMAHLKLDRRTRSKERYDLISELLDIAGLKDSAHTRIGDIGDDKILSGGEKKRLAFATELLNKPVLLFCDEPTSGLDSYSAEKLIGTLQALARRGTTIMCTIHQPSSQLFSMFSQVLLLAEGRVAFSGAPSQALSFFAKHGHVCPESYNPADFLIGILATPPGCEKASQRCVQRICDLFAVSPVCQQNDVLVSLEMHMSETAEFEIDEERERFYAPFWHVTIFWLMYRSFVTVLRDPTVQLLRIVQKIAIALMVGLCFYGSIQLNQPGIQSVQGALFLMISENTFSPMYSVLSVFPQGFPLFMREKRSGMYSTAQYYIANVIAMLPGLVVEPILFVIVGYWLAGLRPNVEAFLFTAFAALLVINVSTACGCFFSVAFNSVSLAMAYLVPFDYILMITSGVFVKLNIIPAYLAWMKNMSWMMYANEIMSIVQWEGVKNITCYENNPELPCITTGDEVMELYNFSFDDLYLDIGALIGLYAIFHILGYIFLVKRSRD